MIAKEGNHRERVIELFNLLSLVTNCAKVQVKFEFTNGLELDLSFNLGKEAE